MDNKDIGCIVVTMVAMIAIMVIVGVTVVSSDQFKSVGGACGNRCRKNSCKFEDWVNGGFSADVCLCECDGKIVKLY